MSTDRKRKSPPPGLTRGPGGGRKPLDPEKPTVRKTVTLLADQVDHLTQGGLIDLSKSLRRIIDIDRADEWIVEIDSLAEQVPDVRKRFPERWRAEQWAAEQFDLYRNTQGSIYVCAIVDGQDVMLYELSLNRAA